MNEIISVRGTEWLIIGASEGTRGLWICVPRRHCCGKEVAEFG